MASLDGAGEANEGVSERIIPCLREKRAMNPVTLADLIRENRLIWVYCNDCCREQDLDPATIQLPQDMPVRGVQEKRI